MIVRDYLLPELDRIWKLWESNFLKMENDATELG